MVETDPLLDSLLLGRAPDVFEDRGSIGNRLRAGPWPEAETERVHARVRADSRVAEEIPGAAEVRARLEDCVTLARTALLQVVGGANAGDPGADYENVHVL